MANSATVGILRVLLTANAAEFEAAMKTAQNAAQQWSKQLGDIGRQASQLGSSLTRTVTLPLAAMGAGSIKAASDFESSFAGIRKTVNDATDAMGNLTPVGQRLAQGMRDLAKEIPVNVNELNKIGEAAGQLGIKSENILGFTRVMADLGATTNLSSDQAATALARLAAIMETPQTQFRTLADVIVHLGNNLETTESEILDFGMRIAGAGKIAGLTEGQILAIGGAMSSVGIEAEAGGTAVQKVLLSMTEAVATGNKDLQVFAATAGMSAKEFAEAWKTDAAGAFTAFVEGLGRSGTEAFKILEQLDLQDQRLIRSFLNLSGAGDKLAESMRLQSEAVTVGGQSAKEAEQRYKTFESELTKLWNRAKDVGITLGESLVPILKDMLTALTPVIEAAANAAKWFAGLPEPLRLTALGFVGVVAAVGPMLFIFGQVVQAAGLVMGALGTKGLLTTLTTLGGSMSGLASVTIPALALALAKLAIPVAAAGAAVVALHQAYQLYRESADRAKSAEDDQQRRYAMMAEASRIAGRAVSTYAEAVQVVTKHARENADAQERLQTVYTESAGPAERLATTQRNVATSSAELTATLAALGGATRSVTASKRELIPVLQTFGAEVSAIANGPGAQWLAMNYQLAPALSDAAAKADILAATLPPLASNTAIATQGFEQFKTAVTQVTSTPITGWLSSLTESLGRLPGLLQAAFTGGGSMKGAFNALFSDIGAGLFAAGGPLNALGNKMTGFMTNLFGESIGGAFGMILPGLGSLIGPLLSNLAGKIGGFFRNLFGGVSPEIKQSRQELEQFQSTLRGAATDAQRLEAAQSGWADKGALDVIRVRDAYLAVGKSADEAMRDVEAMWDTDNPERSRAAIERINGVLKEQAEILEKGRERAGELYDELLDASAETGERLPAHFLPAIDRLREMGLITDEQAAKLRGLAEEGHFDLEQLKKDAESLGIEFNGLGPKFQTADLNAKFTDLFQKMSRLINAGGDVGHVLSGSADEISALIVEAKKFGVAMPAQFKPWVEELLRAGKLTDENGNKLEDLSGVNFGDPIVTAMEKVVDKFQEFVDTILRQVIPAIDRIPKDVKVRVGVDDSEVRGYQPPDLRPQPVPFEGGTVPVNNLSPVSTASLASPLALSPIASAVPSSAVPSLHQTVILPMVMGDKSEFPKIVSEAQRHMAERGISGNLFGLREVIENVAEDVFRRLARV